MCAIRLYDKITGVSNAELRTAASSALQLDTSELYINNKHQKRHLEIYIIYLVS